MLIRYMLVRVDTNRATDAWGVTDRRSLPLAALIETSHLLLRCKINLLCAAPFC